MAPMLKSVEEAGITGIRIKRDPSGISPEDFFIHREKLRKEFSRLINNPWPGRIALLPSVSYGMATVANNLSINREENIVLADEQFPSNYYPWHRLASDTNARLNVISAPQGQERGKKWNERILEAIDAKTRMVAIGNVHWADGTLFNLKQLRKRTDEVGALLIVDGTQSIGAMPFDVQAIKPDALICAGYKWLLGPYSSALAYFGKYFDDGKPVEDNWINRIDSEDFSGLVNYKHKYRPLAQRYDVGESSNFILVPMLLEAVKILNKWGPVNIQEYCRSLLKGLTELLLKKGLRIEADRYRAHHIIGLRLPQKYNLASLKHQFDIREIRVSIRGNAIRISPNVYNTEEDLYKLIECFN